MNDFEPERKKKQWRMCINSGGRNEGKTANLFLHRHLCLSLVSISAEIFRDARDAQLSTVTRLSVAPIPTAAGGDTEVPLRMNADLRSGK